MAATGVPLVPDPAGGNGYKIERTVYTPDGDPADITTVGQNDRFVVALTVTAEHDAGGRLLVVDPIPAGFEIENPDISASRQHGEPRLARGRQGRPHRGAHRPLRRGHRPRRMAGRRKITVAYTVRAVSPGTFVYPAATVEDMYRPEFNARTATGKVEVVGPTR